MADEAPARWVMTGGGSGRWSAMDGSSELAGRRSGTWISTAQGGKESGCCSGSPEGSGTTEVDRRRACGDEVEAMSVGDVARACRVVVLRCVRMGRGGASGTSSVTGRWAPEWLHLDERQGSGGAGVRWHHWGGSGCRLRIASGGSEAVHPCGDHLEVEGVRGECVT